MIKREYYKTREDGVLLYSTYSDSNLYIRKVGTEEIYSEAVDVSWAEYTYEETNEPIEEEQAKSVEQEKGELEEWTGRE